MSQAQVQRMIVSLGCQQGPFPFVYLGLLSILPDLRMNISQPFDTNLKVGWLGALL